ncbi:MAG TPA: M50 family metallopeptidase, partial [Myxococcaceae bacterium]|nr:M50 family metallopeptidase [Myxococcaceae bacterium]
MRFLAAILSLGFLIALHELGHLLVARAFGIRIERLALGIGPALFSGRRRGTALALKAIPIGAFVQIRGMNPHALSFDRSDSTSFASKSAGKRALVIAAGPLANLILALALLVGLYARGTHVPVPMTVGTVAPGSEAAKAQLRPGDRILAVDGTPVEQWSALLDAIVDNAGNPMRLTVMRDGRSLDLLVWPRRDPRGAARIGISQQYVYREHRFNEAVAKSFGHVRRLFAEGIRSLKRLARENVGAEMVQQFADASVIGLDSFLRALVSLSLALATFYLLPLPPLDGGRLVLLAIEVVRGRPVNSKMESLISALGMLALIAAVGWLLARDVARLVISGFPSAGAGSAAA